MDDYKGEGGLWDKAILPTVSSAVENASPMDFAKAGLGALFYSGDAEGALLTPTGRKADILARMKAATKADGSKKYTNENAWNRLNIAASGDEFIPDNISPDLANILKNASIDRPVFMEDLASLDPRYASKIRLADVSEKDLGPHVRGSVQGGTGGQGGQGTVQISPNFPQDEMRATLAHELQHLYDKAGNRTSGTNDEYLNSIPGLVDLWGNSSKNIPLKEQVPWNMYQHNYGEVRARLNAMLNKKHEARDRSYTKISDTFHPSYPQRAGGIWQKGDLANWLKKINGP